jgi:hypothetical protein
MLFLSIPAQRDDYQVWPEAFLTDSPRQLKTIHSWQADVEKNDIRLEGAEAPERNRSILGDADDVAVAREDQPQTLSDIVIIFDHKNAPAHRPDRLVGCFSGNLIHQRPHCDPDTKYKHLPSVARRLTFARAVPVPRPDPQVQRAIAALSAATKDRRLLDG